MKPKLRGRGLWGALTALLCGVVLHSGLGVPSACGAEKTLPSDLAMVPRETAGFVTIRVSDLAAGEVGKQLLPQMRKEGGGLLAEVQKTLLVPLTDVERVTFLHGIQVAIVRTNKAFDRDKLLDALGGKAEAERYKGKTLFVVGDQALLPIDDHAFVRGPLMHVRRLLDAGPQGQGNLAEPLALAAGKHTVVVGQEPIMLLRSQELEAMPAPRGEKKATGPADVAPPPPVDKKPPEASPLQVAAQAEERSAPRPDVKEVLRNLPPELLPYLPFFQARYLVLLLDVDDSLKGELRVVFPNADLAADGETAVKTSLYVARELLGRAGREFASSPEMEKQLQPILQQVQGALKAASVKTEANTVTVAGRLKVDAAAYAAAAMHIREQALHIQSANNLKQIGLAMMNYESAMGSLPPPALLSKDGKPLLSWRVAILPYLEEDALYNQFHLDEPWDSEQNKKLLAKMPKVYTPLKNRPKDPTATYCQLFVGPMAPFQIAPGGGPFNAIGPRMVSFADGTSNTFLVAEAGEAVPWTKPADIPFDPKKPVPKLGGDFGFAFHVVMADGAVKFIKTTIDQDLLKLLIMPADGYPFDWDKVPEVGGRPRGPSTGESVPIPPSTGGSAIKPPVEKK